MSAQSVRATSMMNGRIRSRELLIAKAIRSGFNPYCRSTDKDARRVSDEMLSSVQNVRLPERRKTAPKTAKKPPIRELRRMSSRPAAPVGHHEVIAIENFELVKRKPNRIPVGKLASVTACALILSAIVYGGSLINEEARRYSELNDGLEALQKENQTLELALKEKNDLTVIEERASDLGMVKVSSAEQRYLPLSEEDGISTFTQEKKDNTFGMNMLNAFGEKIGDFLEYLE